MTGAHPDVLRDRYALRVPWEESAGSTYWSGYDRTERRDVLVQQLRPQASDGRHHGRDTAKYAAWAPGALARQVRPVSEPSNAHLLAVHDVIEEADALWVVMEPVVPRSLHTLLRAHGRLPSAAAAHIGLEVASALEALHAAGAAHGQIGPRGILFREDGTAALPGYGFQPADPAYGAPPLCPGRPRSQYTAPELTPGGKHDAALAPTPQGDLWALGMTLYEMVEGRRPLRGPLPGPRLKALRDARPPRVRRQREFAPLVEGLLAPRPGARPTMASVTAALRAAADRQDPVTDTHWALATPQRRTRWQRLRGLLIHIGALVGSRIAAAFTAGALAAMLGLRLAGKSTSQDVATLLLTAVVLGLTSGLVVLGGKCLWHAVAYVRNRGRDARARPHAPRTEPPPPGSAPEGVGYGPVLLSYPPSVTPHPGSATPDDPPHTALTLGDPRGAPAANRPTKYRIVQKGGRPESGPPRRRTGRPATGRPATGEPATARPGASRPPTGRSTPRRPDASRSDTGGPEPDRTADEPPRLGLNPPTPPAPGREPDQPPRPEPHPEATPPQPPTHGAEAEAAQEPPREAGAPSRPDEPPPAEREPAEREPGEREPADAPRPAEPPPPANAPPPVDEPSPELTSQERARLIQRELLSPRRRRWPDPSQPPTTEPPATADETPRWVDADTARSATPDTPTWTDAGAAPAGATAVPWWEVDAPPWAADVPPWARDPSWPPEPPPRLPGPPPRAAGWPSGLPGRPPDTSTPAPHLSDLASLPPPAPRRAGAPSPFAPPVPPAGPPCTPRLTLRDGPARVGAPAVLEFALDVPDGHPWARQPEHPSAHLVLVAAARTAGRIMPPVRGYHAGYANEEAATFVFTAHEPGEHQLRFTVYDRRYGVVLQELEAAMTIEAPARRAPEADPPPGAPATPVEAADTHQAPES
ncbi:protein kinase domain-containing protein [Streptomyces buecherae]|uniref:Protein kinase n=1 Tax=Streptomyces buecherae TaxID=2763006 RepID=A0A7H8ND49_9ACTN|nr:protein kinase [Streptomyces buecherae]QKW52407.1 protein kinase [Streptomyces buecherae]